MRSKDVPWMKARDVVELTKLVVMLLIVLVVSYGMYVFSGSFEELVEYVAYKVGDALGQAGGKARDVVEGIGEYAVNRTGRTVGKVGEYAVNRTGRMLRWVARPTVSKARGLSRLLGAEAA